MTTDQFQRNRENFCYRHPDRQSFVLCQRCLRTICPECQTQGAVGVICPECLRDQQRAQSPAQAKAERRAARPRAVAVRDTRPLATYVIIGIMTAAYLLDAGSGIRAGPAELPGVPGAPALPGAVRHLAAVAPRDGDPGPRGAVAPRTQHARPVDDRPQPRTAPRTGAIRHPVCAERAGRLRGGHPARIHDPGRRRIGRHLRAVRCAPRHRQAHRREHHGDRGRARREPGDRVHPGNEVSWQAHVGGLARGRWSPSSTRERGRPGRGGCRSPADTGDGRAAALLLVPPLFCF